MIRPILALVVLRGGTGGLCAQPEIAPQVSASSSLIEFTCQESHCGQVEYLPKGWSLLATHGAGGKTKNQLMKVDGYPICAAQFHIDMGGDHAKVLAKNFLDVARRWQRQSSGEHPPVNSP